MQEQSRIVQQTPVSQRSPLNPQRLPSTQALVFSPHQHCCNEERAPSPLAPSILGISRTRKYYSGENNNEKTRRPATAILKIHKDCGFLCQTSDFTVVPTCPGDLGQGKSRPGGRRRRRCKRGIRIGDETTSGCSKSYVANSPGVLMM